MPRERQIQTLYPPVFLGAALLWAWHETQARTAAFHEHRWVDTLRTLQDTLLPHETVPLLAWFAVGGLILLVAGHGIGVLCRALLRSISALGIRLGRSWSPEAVMTVDLRRRVWRDHFGASGRPIRDHGSAVVTAFGQARLDPGLRDWIERRLDVFHSNASSTLGLLLAMAFVAAASWRPGPWWWAGTLLTAATFGAAARFAHRDVRRMNDLLADTLPDWATAGASRGRLHALEPVRQRLQQAARSWSPRH